MAADTYKSPAWMKNKEFKPNKSKPKKKEGATFIGQLCLMLTVTILALIIMN